MKQLAVVGAGERGEWLGILASKNGRARICAAVETDKTRLDYIQKKFDIPPDNCYVDYHKFLDAGHELDGIFLATPPNTHADIACACLEAGYKVFLEKPIAHNLEDARRIVNTAQKIPGHLQVGFNLRYAPFFVKLKEIVNSGQLGTILSIEWKEVLALWHWTRYYCRSLSYTTSDKIGNWLLEKCCHDIDILSWLIEKPCVRAASFASRSYFNQRSDVPGHCGDNCPIEKECVFSAFKFNPELRNSDTKSLEWKTRCVYNVKSDLVDHQSTILEYGNGVTVCFSLMPLGPQDTRLLRICGTKGTLRGSSWNNEICISDYASGKEIDCAPDENTEDGHGGADQLVVDAFLDWLNAPEKSPKTNEKEGWESMVIGCGIHTAATEHRVVELDYR